MLLIKVFQRELFSSFLNYSLSKLHNLTLVKKGQTGTKAVNALKHSQTHNKYSQSKVAVAHSKINSFR